MHYTQHCTSQFPAAKVQSLQSTESRCPHTSRTLGRTTAIVRPEPPPLCDGTSPLHSNTHSNTTIHLFQLVFQSRFRSGRSRRCGINKRKKALRNSKRHVRMHGTDRRCNTRTVKQSRSSTLETTSTQCSLRSNGQGSRFLTAIRCRLTPITVLPQEGSRWLQSHTGSETS